MARSESGCISGGELIADTTHPKLVWEKPYYPTYYFPEADVRVDALIPTGHTTAIPEPRQRPMCSTCDQRAARRPSRPHIGTRESPIEELRDDGGIRLGRRWTPGSKKTRRSSSTPAIRTPGLTSCPSSRHIEVSIDGVTVADSRNARLLFETGPPVAVLPAEDRRAHGPADADRHSHTHCPYKGTAELLRRSTVDEAATRTSCGGTELPLPESAGLGGLVSFYNEKVDIRIDGEPVERPKTVFS